MSLLVFISLLLLSTHSKLSFNQRAVVECVPHECNCGVSALPPTETPTFAPTAAPTAAPTTNAPATNAPTQAPTVAATEAPLVCATEAPVVCDVCPAPVVCSTEAPVVCDVCPAPVVCSTEAPVVCPAPVVCSTEAPVVCDVCDICPAPVVCPIFEPVVCEVCDEAVEVECASGILKVQTCDYHIKYDLEALYNDDASLAFVVHNNKTIGVDCDGTDFAVRDEDGLEVVAHNIQGVQCVKGKVHVEYYVPVKFLRDTGVELHHVINHKDDIQLTL